MSSAKSILVSGYYGFDNSGDDAILKAIVKDIRSLDSKLNIVVLSNNPEKTNVMYNVKAINRFKFMEVIKAIKSTSLLISGGGSLLQDVTSTRSLLYYLAVMSLAKFLRKPIMVYANGIGPINGNINRKLSKVILDKVDLITLRDEDSKVYLSEMGVKNKNIFVTADPVFTLEASSEEHIDNIFVKEGIPDNKSFIGISIRKWKSATNLVEIVSKTIDYIIDKYQVDVILIPMHYPEDLEISLEVLDKVKSSNCHVLRDKYSVEEIMGVIHRLDLIIAMRLHSLIYAAGQEVPMVGLVYDPKVEGILNSLNMNYMCNVDDLDFEELIGHIDIVWNNKEELKESLKLQDLDLKKKAISNVNMALELLKAGE
ncbi:MAG: polysaccharide pyruvyl transferase CsaB [Tissierellaceae bacterium]|nr:polysaccharide pyruvyl transferase CsaB [Tissierellaceae bacterium]